MNRSPTAFVADLNNLMQEYGVVIMYDTHGLYLADWSNTAPRFRLLALEPHPADAPDHFRLVPAGDR
jgi:hypothetical protein